MDTPIAVQGIDFTRSTFISGLALLNRIQWLCNTQHRGFVCKRRWFNGNVYLAGQTGSAYDSILVTSDLDRPGIRPEGRYNSILVVSHTWDYDPGQDAMGYSDDKIIDAVINFAKALEEFVNSAILGNTLSEEFVPNKNFG